MPKAKILAPIEKAIHEIQSFINNRQRWIKYGDWIKKNKPYLIRSYIFLLALVAFESQPILMGQSLLPGFLVAVTAYLSGELYLLQSNMKTVFRYFICILLCILLGLTLQIPFLLIGEFSSSSLGMTILALIIWGLSYNQLIREVIGENIAHQHPRFRFFAVAFLYLMFIIYFSFADKLNIPAVLGLSLPEQLKSIPRTAQFIIIIGIGSTFVFLLTLAGTIKLDNEKRSELVSIAQKFFITTLLLVFFEGFDFILEQITAVKPENLTLISYGTLYWASVFFFLASTILFGLGVTDFTLALGNLYDSKNKMKLSLYQKRSPKENKKLLKNRK